MAELTYLNPKVLATRTITTTKKAVVIETTASKNDTIAISELTTLTACEAWNASTGAQVDVTIDTNKVKVTEDSLVAVKIIVCVVGT